MLKLGTHIVFSRRYHKQHLSFTTKHGYGSINTWLKVDIEKKQGILIGYRHIRNTYVTDGEDYDIEVTKVIKCALVVCDLHTNPIYVPLDSIVVV